MNSTALTATSVFLKNFKAALDYSMHFRAREKFSTVFLKITFVCLQIEAHVTEAFH